jgi:hypothetical protein
VSLFDLIATKLKTSGPARQVHPSTVRDKMKVDEARRNEKEEEFRAK